MAVKKTELYSMLWEACNKLRGGVEPARYKDYVLVLLFFKYVSDRYKGQPFAEFTISKGASFEDLIAAKGKSDVGERVDKIIQKFLEDNRLQGSLPEVSFNNPEELGSGKELVDKVSGLIAVFQNPAIDFKNNRASGDDIIGNEKYTGDVLFQKTYTDSSFNRHQNRGELDQYLMQDHHEAIISKEEFELANAVLKQRGREKGNGHDTGRYQNRYGFSGRICCGECGGKYKRRMHYKPSGQYVAWACANHLKDKESCSQKYITDDALKLAFVTMLNKLVFGHQLVLRPLLQSLRGLNDQSRLLKIEELETAIEKNREQKQVLTNLMASGYLEPALFNKESNELAAEAEALRQEKDGLMRSVNGDMVKIEELQRLLRFTSKGTMMTEFDDEIFLSFVERITVLSRKEVVFEWKCGLSLKERLVEP